MDINIIYNEIIEKLKGSNNMNVITDLENSAKGASTGGEALMATGFFLANLKHNNPSIYYLIEKQIKKYLSYCKKNGLIINC